MRANQHIEFLGNMTGHKVQTFGNPDANKGGSS